MIEFWPDCCGYKIQVDDAEAGKWIRCPYCNARVQVPEKTPDDNVLAEAISDLPDELATPTAGQISGPAFGRRARGLDPVRVAIKAVIIVVAAAVVTVVVRQAIWFLESRKTEVAGESPTPSASGRSAAPAPAAVDVLAELPRGQAGVFVDSYPADLMVFVREIEGRFDTPELLSLDAMEASGRAPIAVPESPASYWIFVSARLNSPQLMRLPGYPDLRRELEKAADVQAAAEYFLVDGANRLEYRESSLGLGSLVKAYRVTVEPGNWTNVTCFFLPRSSPSQLLSSVPSTPRYRVDDAAALMEMEYRGIPLSERAAMLELLRRCGKTVRYEPETGLWRIFQITPLGLLSPAVEAVGPGQWQEPKRNR